MKRLTTISVLILSLLCSCQSTLPMDKLRGIHSAEFSVFIQDPPKFKAGHKFTLIDDEGTKFEGVILKVGKMWLWVSKDGNQVRKAYAYTVKLYRGGKSMRMELPEFVIN